LVMDLGGMPGAQSSFCRQAQGLLAQPVHVSVPNLYTDLVAVANLSNKAVLLLLAEYPSMH
jgi:hypothetical protein